MVVTFPKSHPRSPILLRHARLFGDSALARCQHGLPLVGHRRRQHPGRPVGNHGGGGPQPHDELVACDGDAQRWSRRIRPLRNPAGVRYVRQRYSLTSSLASQPTDEDAPRHCVPSKRVTFPALAPKRPVEPGDGRRALGLPYSGPLATTLGQRPCLRLAARARRHTQGQTSSWPGGGGFGWARRVARGGGRPGGPGLDRSYVRWF